MASKTQQAYEAALAGDPKALDVLTGMAIRKCRGITPPASQDANAKTMVHAFRRLRSHRYQWIRDWLIGAIKNPNPGDTGSRVVTRCWWALHKTVRAEYRGRRKAERDGPKRFRRSTLPTRAALLAAVSTLPAIAEPELRDLWERLLEAYPDWKLMTNVYLAGAMCLHPNTVASRRHALAVIQHAAAQGCYEQWFALEHGLRLVIGRCRKTDIHRVEAHAGEVLTRMKLVKKLQLTGYATVVEWAHGSRKGAASGTFYQVPTFEPLEKVNSVHQDLPPRCPYVDPAGDGRQCVYAAHRCPHHQDKAKILV